MWAWTFLTTAYGVIGCVKSGCFNCVSVIFSVPHHLGNDSSTSLRRLQPAVVARKPDCNRTMKTFFNRRRQQVESTCKTHQVHA